MHMAIHGATAIPFLVAGLPLGAVGCVLPDVVQIPREVEIRSRRLDAATYLNGLTEREIWPYRVTHSVAFAVLLMLLDPMLAAGVAIHVLLDLPTHAGRYAQQPLWPVRWSWPNAFRLRRYRDAVT
jgi:membrane-bound metal-dependent hydrolase YbcI (DUF457 family)